MKQTAKQVDVVIMAGGTGGHIFPGLAVAEKLRAQGYSVAWLGAHGLETTLVPKHNIELYSLSIKGLRGNGLKGWLMLPFKMLKAVREAKAILKMLSPKCVIGFGGFASGPGGLAANALKIPLMIHEQNAVPGMTNRYLAKMSQHVMTGFPLPQWANSQYVGNPVREALFQLPNIQTRFAGHDANELRVLVVGGSQGSRFLNTIVPTVIAGSKRNIAVWHQTGQKLFDEANASWATTGVTPFRIAPFIEDMGEAYAWADIIICRAGALTLAELTAVGLGSILIPLPTAVDDHQRKNAAFLVQSDAAYCIDEKTFDAQQMITILDGITLERAQEMAENAHKNAKPKAVEEIAEAIERTF
ncbi:undecaprenyldiphospho-muramoylpentapeptide beta-N-acetylglucosaminyltransferase [Wohlfahrtiimonas chitiniclastica]|uniref:undecaprenyldiphospho-muramoylpentapeptide beta-N-acetylglucosaminyltransferase n=1 Tax=Wohlfahrtiimonas chitiniclastica TaxID=400946 RepID=UPI0007B69BAF|nr:undecaprenyldiphospho-muramoylpentapeptide beta-N-acetylglucosaminyltransferase [Wohlfahrtiimonas chitiniclastica]KZX36786.1 UDP-N-acetylglucosamine--N-acetylmuramyl-(pentapeptide) pyrophosphoryl-undecaprenol N-acetylglucosamine transferase [Wohlfahrtiimonas chitiniclastica]MBS7821435.1 undecaprenyldiphospho-muramoylpentapeptide beta-N-acetylglucosaminyltransferase [Wohlfahrtiimonas chitiniclastica]MBS7835006.1 undecaprenyldiphospho-muramoylpentapeptide beta-N-acetylglucosaminyltransferase [W